MSVESGQLVEITARIVFTYFYRKIHSCGRQQTPVSGHDVDLQTSSKA
jgi:hypothetical protein